jgi:hypothetical protein
VQYDFPITRKFSNVLEAAFSNILLYCTSEFYTNRTITADSKGGFKLSMSSFMKN